jgi:phage gp16-like protein
MMNYLEEELDETINTLKISSKKLNSEEIATLISTLTKKYFKTEKNVLDPVDFNEKCTEHNPDFWKEIPDRIKKKRPHTFGF